MRRADRLFRLVQLLRNRRLVTAEFLAQELGTSQRTIYRDIQDLSRSGVPVRGEAGVGYALESKHELPPMTFTTDEISALVLGTRMVEAWGDAELAESARAALAKIEAVVPEPLREALTQTLMFAPRGFWTELATEQLPTIRKGVDTRRKVAIDYEREDGEHSERVIRPLGLYFFGAKWLVGSWCELRTDYRSFRVDRIARATLLDDRFDGSDGIDLAGFLERTTGPG